MAPDWGRQPFTYFSIFKWLKVHFNHTVVIQSITKIITSLIRLPFLVSSVA